MSARSVLLLILLFPGLLPWSHGAPEKSDSKKAPAAAKPPAPAPIKVDWKPVYYKNRAYVPADQVSQYYDLNPPVEKGRSITLRTDKPITENGFSIEFTRGEKRVLINGWTFYFSFPVVDTKDKPHVSVFDVRNVLDPILRPSDRREPATLKTVIIDPAGGGKDTGIKSPAINEKDLTLDVALRLRPLLEQAGLNVLLIRETDQGMAVTERVHMANAVREEAVYISLRANSASGSAKGLESSTLPPAATPATWEPDPEKPDRRFFAGNINDRESLALATTMQNSTVRELQMLDLGIKRLRWEELRDIGHPGVVFRMGYLSNREEAKKLAGAEHRQKLAAALASGVQRYAKYLAHGMAERAASDAKRAMSLGKITAECLEGKTSDGDTGQRIRLNMGVLASDTAIIDRSRVEVQMYLFEKKDGSEIDLTTADPPAVQWMSVLPDWVAVKEEQLQVDWVRPPFSPTERKVYGRRTYCGYVARLIYDGQLMDETADPANLNRALYHFLPVFPRR